MEHPLVPSNVRCCSPALQHPTLGGGGGAVWGTDQWTDEKCGYEKGSRRLQVEKERNNLKKNHVRMSQGSGSIIHQPRCNR